VSVCDSFWTYNPTSVGIGILYLFFWRGVCRTW